MSSSSEIHTFSQIIDANFSDNEQLALKVQGTRLECEMEQRKQGKSLEPDAGQIGLFNQAHKSPHAYSEELFMTMEAQGFPRRYLSLLSKAALFDFTNNIQTEEK